MIHIYFIFFYLLQTIKMSLLDTRSADTNCWEHKSKDFNLKIEVIGQLSVCIFNRKSVSDLILMNHFVQRWPDQDW